MECYDPSLLEYDHTWCHLVSNAGHPDTYNCTFPAMINDWRAKSFEGTQEYTEEEFPFGFVQVS